jgi:hypothetical protein
MDTGFYFEVNEGRSQFSMSVNYDERYDKFASRVYSNTFDWPPNTPFNSLFDEGVSDAPKYENISNKHETVQTFFISRARARIFLNTKFWEGIGEWSKKMQEIEKVVEKERYGKS